MRINRLLLFVILGLFLPTIVSAQKDSLKTNNYPTKFITEYGIDRNLSYVYEDTVIRKNEIYSTYNQKSGLYQDLGNIMTPGRNLFFDWNKLTDFVLGFNPYQAYYKTPQESRYYLTKKPYADFKYTQGQRELLLFSAKVAYNLTPRLNVGVDFDRITSEGFYPRQYTSGYFTNVFMSYQSKNSRYGVIANTIWNRGINDENGGLAGGDSLFETLRGPNKAAPVYLENSQSRFKSKTYYAKQYFYLGKMQEQVKDEDTTYLLSRSGFISHSIRFDEDKFYFDNIGGEGDTILFPSDNIDSSGIFYDSIVSRTFMNRVSYSYWTKSNQYQQSFVEFAVAHKYIHVEQFDLSNTYNNIWGEAKLERIPKTNNNVAFRINGTYCLSGYNQNDFKVGGDIKLLWRKFDVSAGLNNQLSEVDYTMANFRSAPFTWNNDFGKTYVSNWRLGIGTKTFRHNFTATFNQYIIANWVYHGKEIKPIQSNEVLVINTLEASKTIQLGWFFFENKLMLQNSNLGIVNLPELGANLRYYLNGSLFKKALMFQLGAEMFYNTSYYGNAYNPAARAFYLQDDTKIGNYPMIDVFLTGQIMTAVIFVKYEHVNMDWKNTGYYLTPHYPIPVRALRFGFRLRLYN